MRTILYGRVSLQEDGQQYGMDSQLRGMREYAEAKGYSGIEELTDDGYLGGDLDRPSLERMREMVRSRQVDVVIAHDPDRLARNPGRYLLLEEEFERAGVRLEFVTTPVEKNAEGKLLLHVKAVIAEYEKEKIKERTVRGRREKAKQGYIVGGRIA
jgi:site-specific DNA recombinase